jgi:hypothetical protein
MDLLIVFIIVAAAAVLVGRRIWRSLRSPAHGAGAPACGAYCASCRGRQTADCHEIGRQA